MIELVLGLMAGIISGFGMGGGAILITLLSIYKGIDQHVAQATNLIFFIPTSIAAIIVNIKNKKIDFKTGFQIIIYGEIGVLIGFYVGQKLETNILKKYFGIFLFIIALYETYNIIKNHLIPYKNHE